MSTATKNLALQRIVRLVQKGFRLAIDADKYRCSVRVFQDLSFRFEVIKPTIEQAMSEVIREVNRRLRP